MSPMRPVAVMLLASQLALAACTGAGGARALADSPCATGLTYQKLGAMGGSHDVFVRYRFDHEPSPAELEEAFRQVLTEARARCGSAPVLSHSGRSESATAECSGSQATAAAPRYVVGATCSVP